MSKIKLGFRRKTEGSLQLAVHPGSAAYIARVLSIRFPNVRFEVRDSTDRYIYAHARDKFTDRMQQEYHEAISVLEIVWQLSGGEIGRYIHA